MDSAEQILYAILDIETTGLSPAREKITEIAMQMWDKEAEKGPKAAKALEMLKDYLKSLGHL